MSKAFNNDPEFKTQMIEAAKAHQMADEYVAGKYHDKSHKTFHGCSVGCSLHDVQKLRGVDVEDYSDHKLLAKTLGVPEWLVRLQDTLFEGVSGDRRPALTGELLSAIPVGLGDAAWAQVEHRLHISIQKKNIERVQSLDIDDDVKIKVSSAINGVIDLHQHSIDLGSAERSAWSAAQVAAESTARSAESARSAAHVAAWSASRSATWADAWAAERLAESARLAAQVAAWSTEESAARSTAYDDIADILVEILEELTNE